MHSKRRGKGGLMKIVLAAAMLMYACTGVFADAVDTQKAFKISGKYIAEESNLNENAESPTSHSGLVDLSTTTIVVTYESYERVWRNGNGRVGIWRVRGRQRPPN